MARSTDTDAQRECERLRAELQAERECRQHIYEYTCKLTRLVWASMDDAAIKQFMEQLSEYRDELQAQVFDALRRAGVTELTPIIRAEGA